MSRWDLLLFLLPLLTIPLEYFFGGNGETTLQLAVAPIVPALIAGAGLVKGAMDSSAASAQNAAAMDQREKAYREWLKLNLPSVEDQKLALERYKQVGELIPAFEEAVQRGDTNFANVSEDPRLKEAQLAALASLENIAERGGRTLDQDAYLAKVTNDVAASDRSRRQAIQQNLAERGMGNISGLELAAKLDSAGDATDRESQAALEASRNAELNALAALEKRGSLAGDVRGQDYRVASDLASARDSVDAFNANMLAGTRQRNTDRENAARGTNLQEKQRIADQNTGLSNQEQAHNKRLIQQQFENQLQKTSGISNAYTGNANAMQKQASDTANAANNWLQGGVKAGASAWDAFLKSDKGSPQVKTGESVTTSDNSGYGKDDDDDYWGRTA